MSIDWDSEIKGPQDAILDLPQERITGDILRGRGPRRGNLERLIKYWRPIMRKPGGFRRCLVILADHPELYPLERICAWLHHETTGLWPNEGNHHEGGKLGPIVRAAKRTVKKPKKRKRRGRKDLGESEFYDYEYSFKDVVSQSRVFNGLMVQPIRGRQNVIDYKAAMFMDRLEELSERKQDIEFKKVGIVGSGSAAGQGLQAVGSILLPGDISAFRSPIRSQIYETLTPGGGRGVRRGLRRVVRGAGRGARNKFRCPPGFQKGGTFTNKFYSTCGAQILGIPSFGPGAFTAGIERALARLARDASLVRSIGDLKNNSNPYAVIRAAQIPFAPKKTSPTRRQTSVDLVLARIANGENVPTRFVRRDGVILEPLVSFEELGKLDEFDDMVDGSLMTVYKEGILGEGSLGTFGTGLRDNYITIEDEGVVKVSRVGGELEQGVRDKTVRAFNASIAKAERSRNPDRTAPLMDFIEASNGKFSVEFGEIKNNRFVPENTAKNELITVRSGNITKLVPKWVYDTFLSRSAPRRLESDPIFELVEGDAKSIPFFNSQKLNKENIHLARDYFNLVNEKAARFTNTVEDTEFDVKAPRFGRRLARGAGRGAGRGIRGTASAVFDSDLGRFRCPPGTRYGGTFTDRLGTNCGYSLPNRLVDNLEKASQAAKSIVRGIRTPKNRAKQYKNVTGRIKRLNVGLEEVLNLTESRAGTRLGATVGQRRSIDKLTSPQTRLFSGEEIRDTLLSRKNMINEIFEKGDRRSINNLWDELSKLANLEAGRLTVNTDNSERPVRRARVIQDLLDEFSGKLIARANLGDEGRQAIGRDRSTDSDVDVVQGQLKPTLDLRKERFEALRGALSRGRRMKKFGDPIPDAIPSAFYNDDGTVNKEKIEAARRSVGVKLRTAKAALQQTIGSNERDNNKLDEAAMNYLADVDLDNLKEGQSPFYALGVSRNVNTFREMQALQKMDDQKFAEKFDDSVRRIGRVDRQEVLSDMGIEAPSRDWNREGREPIEFNAMEDLGVPEARRSRSAFVQGVKQRAVDKKDGLRTRLDRRLFREYADGNAVDTAVQDTVLENPDLPDSLTEVATVPWQSYGRILDFKQQRDLNGYVAMSELPEAALLDIYERTGIVVAPRGQYDFTEDIEIFAEEILDIPKGQTNVRNQEVAKSRFAKWINNAMGNTRYGDTPNEDSIGAIPVAVGQVRDTNTGQMLDVVAEVVFDPFVFSGYADNPDRFDDDIFVPEESLDEGAGVHTNFVMQLRTNDGTIIYQARELGDDYKLNGLSLGFDFENKVVNLDHVGVNHTVPETFEGFEVVGDPIQFKGGRFANTLINERLMPFLRGAGFEKIKIDGTSGTGAGTWVRYGFTEQAGTLAAPPTMYKRLVSGKNKVITGNLVGNVDSALEKLNNGEDITPDEVIAMAIVGTPETLADMRAIDGVLENSPVDAPGAYEIYSMLVGVNDDGSLKRSTPLYRAMIADDYDLRDSEVNDLNSSIDRAFESFGVTKPEAATSMQTQGNAGKAAAEFGKTKGLDVLAAEGLELDISKRSIVPQTESLWGTPAEGGVAVSTAFRSLPTEMEQQNIDQALRKIAGARDRDAYGKVISRLDKRHFAIMTGEERARYASEIERTLDRLAREGIINEDDPELNELVGLAAALRDTTNFPEEITFRRGMGATTLDDISVDFGDVDTIDNLIDDVKFLVAETDTPADLEKLLKVLEATKADRNGRAVSRDLIKASDMSDSKIGTGLSSLKENFKNKRFKRNPFTLDDTEKNQKIAEMFTVWDELLRQRDRDANDPRRGIDAMMDQVVDIAEAENMTPEEVIQRSIAHTFMETNYWPESELTSGKSSFELWGLDDGDDPDFIPASSMTLNQKQVDDIRVTNNVMQTVLVSIANGPDEPYEALNDPDIMETGTVIGAVNPDGTLVTKEQAREMLVATAKLDERLKAAIDPKGKPNDPVTVVLADTDEDLEQLIKAYDLSSNVPSDDYIFNRVNNFGNVLEETKARKGMPYGKDMISSAVINDMTDPDYIPRKKEIDDWRFASKGMDLNPELDDQVYVLKQQGLTDKEVAERLNIPEFDVGPRAAQSQKNVPEDINARNNAKNARRSDIFDSDQEEVEEEALFGDDDDVLTLDLIRVDRTDKDIPEGDADEADPDTFNINESFLDLDELISRVENAADDLEESIMRQEKRLGIRSEMTQGYAERRGSRRRRRGYAGSRPSGGTPPPPPRDDDKGPRPDGPDGATEQPYTPPAGLGDRDYTREEYDAMPIEDLLWLTSAERWQTGELDPRAMRALRRRVREMDDDELRRYAEGRDFVDDTGNVLVGQNVINEEARRRGLIDSPDFMDIGDYYYDDNDIRTDDALRRQEMGFENADYDLGIPDVFRPENVSYDASERYNLDGPSLPDRNERPPRGPSRPSRRGTSELENVMMDPSKMTQEQMREFALRMVNDDGTMKKLTPQEAEQLRLDMAELQGLTNRRLYTLYGGKDVNDLTIDELIDRINFDPQRNQTGAGIALRQKASRLTDSEFDDLINRVRAEEAENPVETTLGGNSALTQLEKIQTLRNRAGGVPEIARSGTMEPFDATDRGVRPPIGPPRGPVDNINVDPNAPDFQREVWRLRTEEGLSLEEVAKRFDTDRGVIRNAEVNYARSLSTEDRQAAGLRANRAALARDRARLGTDNARMSDVELLDTYGERVWDLRTRQGLTLEETAELLGLDRGQVRRTEASYSRRLPSAVRERDYARGREAAMLRQDVDLMDLGEFPMSESIDEPSSDQRPVAPTGPPTDPTPEEVYNALLFGGDLPENISRLNKVDRFKKLDEHLGSMTPDEFSESVASLGGVNSPNLDGPHEDALAMALKKHNGNAVAARDDLRKDGIDLSDNYLFWFAQNREERENYLANRRGATDGSIMDVRNQSEIIEGDVDDNETTEGLKGKLGRLVRTGIDAILKNQDNKPFRFFKSFSGKQQHVITLGQDSFPEFLTFVDKSKPDGIFGKLTGKGHNVFVTGRTARELLTNKRPETFQLTTSASLQQVARALGFEWNEGVPEVDGSFRKFDTGAGVNLYLVPDAEGKQTLRYVSQSGEIADISTMRGDSIEDDLEMRDLSINSIAIEVDKGATDQNWSYMVYDPADGIKDLGLKTRKVRSDDPDRRKLFQRKEKDAEPNLLVRDGFYVTYDGNDRVLVPITPENTAAISSEVDIEFKKPALNSLGDLEERVLDDPLVALRMIRRAEAEGIDLTPDQKDILRSAALDEIEPFLLRDELNKAIQDVRSTSAYFQRLDELGLLDRMFPNMTIDKTTMGKISSIDRSPSAQIAMLLRGNSADDVIPALRRLGYSEDQIRAVVALHDLKDVTPETAPRIAEGLRDAINTGELSHGDIVSYSEIVGVNVPSAHALADISVMDPTLEDVSDSTFMALQDLHGDKGYNTRVDSVASLLTAAIKRGGGTFDVGTMNNVTSGYAVSKNKSGVKLPITKAIRALAKGKLSPSDKKAVDKALRDMYSVMAKAQQGLGDDPERGVKTVLGAWVKTSRKTDSKGQLQEVLELHFEVSDVYDKDKWDKDDVVAIALQQNQEGIMDLDQVDSGDIEGAYISTGLGSSRAEYLDPDEDVELTQYHEDWKAATAESAKAQKEAAKANMDSISDLLMEKDSKKVIQQLRDAADPNNPFKYQKGVQNDIRSVEDEIEKLENMKRNFEKSYEDGPDKGRILAEFDRILAEKRSGEVQERQPRRRDEADVPETDTGAPTEPAAVAAPRREVVVPDPIDAEMDDVEFEQAINNLRDPIRDSALVDTEGKAIVDEEGTPTFDLGFDKEEFDKANKKVKGVTDKLVNDLIEDLNIPLQRVDELLQEDGTLRPDLDKDEMKDIRSARASRRVAVKKALQNAANKIKINNLPDEEQIEEIVEQGNQAVEDLIDDE